jgi:hypothetical protein
MTKKTTAKPAYGVGIDIGTMNLVAARKGTSGKTETKRMRDAFIDLPADARKMLKLSKTDFIEREEDVLVLGDSAMQMANMLGADLRRPLSDGLISAGEVDSLEVLAIMIKHLLGEPATEDEVCFFSVPAAPVDQDRDVIYHEGVFERIVTECGYEAYASNEAMAIIFAETAKENFSGIGISFGSGMTNVALSVNTFQGLSFSVARGGDWIDKGAAKAIGATAAKICAVKESGMDLNNPENRDQEAIAVYYKSLIEYSLSKIAEQFIAKGDKITLTDPIPIVVSGGTSMIGGFMEFFEKVFKKKRRRFPIKVSEVRHAGSPLNAVAYGLLIQAMQEYGD